MSSEETLKYDESPWGYDGSPVLIVGNSKTKIG